MDYNVRFRVNKHTGQVESFEVDYEGPQTLDDAEHNRRHEQLAAEIGRQIERDPRIMEMLDGVFPELEEDAGHVDDTDTQAGKEKEKNTE